MTLQIRSFTVGIAAASLGTALGAIAAVSPPSVDPATMTMSAVSPPTLDVSTAHSFPELMANAEARMHFAMAHALRTGDPDHDFASEMIAHHQGAIDMAKVELLYGKNAILRRVAQEIIVTQEQEIGVMQRQLATPPGH